MAEYLVFKVKRSWHKDGDTNNQVTYLCETLSPLGKAKMGDREVTLHTHPYTDDNPYRLFGKIASIYKRGDAIKTIPEAEISDNFEGREVELKEPLSHDEMRILSVQVLAALGKKAALEKKQ